MERPQAHYLLGQCLFISFLEHRGIVGNTYRAKHRVQTLRDLVNGHDHTGLTKLLARLKKDFNGDFLDSDSSDTFRWDALDEAAFGCLREFLVRTDIDSKQQSFWTYDFSQIPVELISGIYETFLGNSKHLTGAYYTPRHLALFAVDQAFEGSENPAKEVVYDGACGSGILLTTAYRLMLRTAKNQVRRSLTFHERRQLLLQGIRGSDISETACRVTAFSLYLALLENLMPSDIAQLGIDEQAKLPPLLGKILHGGTSKGEFFSSRNPLAKSGSCSIFLSNPPWYEPKGDEGPLAHDNWLADHQLAAPGRQIAAAFAYKAAMIVRPQGRVCLILPAGLFLSAASQPFLAEWLARFHLDRLVNFSDIRRLLFQEAIHPCVVATGSARASGKPADIRPEEHLIEYWVPKADVSLAFNRLTIHGADRHKLPASSVAANNQSLQALFWGGAHDRALLAKLRMLGTVGALRAPLNRGGRGWIAGKGFHREDKSRESILPGRIAKILFLKANNRPDTPVLDTQLLVPYPASDPKYQKIASKGAHDGKLFDGARVVFPDGVSGDFEMRAFFSNIPFSFQSAVGAIKGPEADADLLRFLAVYLRSPLARYVLLLSTYRMVAERAAVTMQECYSLPFFTPDRHPQPEKASGIVREVAQSMKKIEALDGFHQNLQFEQIQKDLFAAVNRYFGLSATENRLVIEANETLIPSIQPANYESLRTRALSRATGSAIEQYANTLRSELLRLQSKTEGCGELNVGVIANAPSGVAPLGICKVSLAPPQGGKHMVTDDALVMAFLNRLRDGDLVPMQAGKSFSLFSDFVCIADDSIYLIKPLVTRFWMTRAALQDAVEIIRTIREETRYLKGQS